MSEVERDARRRELFARLAEAGSSEDASSATPAQLDILTGIVRRAIRHQRGLQASLARLQDETEILGKRLRKTESGLAALLRRELQALSGEKADPLDLDAQRFSLLSQNEEDGYLLALLKHCGAPNRRFVELGSGRSGGNSGLLAQTAGWHGLMVDASEEATPVAEARFGLSGRVRVVNAFVTPENVDRLIEEAGLAGEVDLFSLDIDSFDYWVLEAMTACRPRVMLVEYNDRFGPEARVTVPPGSTKLDRRRSYFGASLAAVAALAERKDHRLVGCDSSGTNALFVRRDLAPTLPTRAPADAYRENERRRSKPRGDTFIKALAADGLELVEV